MNVYIFGNGNLSIPDFLRLYAEPLRPLLARPEAHFPVGDFRGVDALTMELFNCASDSVSVYHVGDRPRYLPDQFRTRVAQWQLRGDFNSDDARKSGTKKNIEKCLKLGKISLL